MSVDDRKMFLPSYSHARVVSHHHMTMDTAAFYDFFSENCFFDREKNEAKLPGHTLPTTEQRLHMTALVHFPHHISVSI